MSAAVVDTAQHINRRYLLDVVVRVLCVLALDQFADFVGDQVGYMCGVGACVWCGVIAYAFIIQICLDVHILHMHLPHNTPLPHTPTS